MHFLFLALVSLAPGHATVPNAEARWVELEHAAAKFGCEDALMDVRTRAAAETYLEGFVTYLATKESEKWSPWGARAWVRDHWEKIYGQIKDWGYEGGLALTEDDPRHLLAQIDALMADPPGMGNADHFRMYVRRASYLLARLRLAREVLAAKNLEKFTKAVGEVGLSVDADKLSIIKSLEKESAIARMVAMLEAWPEPVPGSDDPYWKKLRAAREKWLLNEYRLIVESFASNYEIIEMRKLARSAMITAGILDPDDQTIFRFAGVESQIADLIDTPPLLDVIRGVVEPTPDEFLFKPGQLRELTRPGPSPTRPADVPVADGWSFTAERRRKKAVAATFRARIAHDRAFSNWAERMQDYYRHNGALNKREEDSRAFDARKYVALHLFKVYLAWCQPELMPPAQRRRVDDGARGLLQDRLDRQTKREFQRLEEWRRKNYAVTKNDQLRAWLAYVYFTTVTDDASLQITPIVPEIVYRHKLTNRPAFVSVDPYWARKTQPMPYRPPLPDRSYLDLRVSRSRW